MAFLNRNDDDIWGGKTSEGKFNSNNGGGYGRHGSTSGTYGRHNTSSRGQGDDLLAEADDVLSFRNNNNSSRSRGNSAREQYEERERERAKRRTARSLGGPGVNRSGKPTIGGSGSGMSPMRNNKSKDFSRPRQNLRFSAVGKNTNVDFGMDDNFLDPFDSDDGDVMEEELPSKSSLKRGIRGRREVVAESIDETDKNRFVEDDYDNEDRWKNGSEKVNRSAKKKAARDRQDLFNDEEDDFVEDFNNNDDDYRGKGRRAAPRNEGKTSDRKEKKPIRMVHSSDDEDEGTMIRRKKQSNTPLKKKKNRRFKESNQKGFMDEVDTEDIGGKTSDRNSKKTKKKKKRGPKPPPDMDDSADEDDMFKIDVPEDRRKMTREVSFVLPLYLIYLQRYIYIFTYIFGLSNYLYYIIIYNMNLTLYIYTHISLLLLLHRNGFKQLDYVQINYHQKEKARHQINHVRQQRIKSQNHQVRMISIKKLMQHQELVAFNVLPIYQI